MSEVTDEYISDARDRMAKTIEATVHNFGSIRTGRANPHLLDRVVVDYYGAQTPLKQLATINAPEARLLTVTPYDKSSMNAIEKAIRNSDLGLNPSNDGNLMRLTVPELTEERRRELVKQVRHIAEEGRVGIRNVRRDVMHDLRELKAEGEIGEDEERRGEQDLQKLTDEKIAELDGILKGKEAEIMEV
jgi:ribosome recycling factor